MALGNRLTTNLDITGNVDGLQRLLNALGKDASKFAETLANAGGDTRGIGTMSRQLGTVLKQAQQLQNVIDAINNKNRPSSGGVLDDQKLGRTAAQVGRVNQEFGKLTSATQVFERRLVDVNKRFAELDKAGRFPNSRDLGKQLKLEQAKKDIQQLEAQLKRLDSAAILTPSKGQSPEIRRIREELDRAYASLQKFASKGTTFNFDGQIRSIQKLQGELKQLISLEGQEVKQNAARAIAAQQTAQRIIAASDAERAAALRRASSQFAFPDVTVAAFGKQGLLDRQLMAEQRLATATAQRLRLTNMINAAQERGAPVRSVERLNLAYQKLERTMAADLALIKQVNRELNNTPEAKSKRINEYLFGDGGISFTKRIAGAAVIGSGVFAAINAVQNSLRFVVDFEKELKLLQAVSGSTDRQLQGLAGSIVEVGQGSIFSTLEITKAATTIAQAGYAAAELDTVLKGAITLSTASGSTPDQAVDTLTSALGAFQLQASDTESIVDSMVTALNRTKLTIEQVQLAVQYAGATAKESNVSFQELLAVSASLAQAGIKRGSVIGTGLRQQFEQFQNPSEKFKEELKDLGLTIADVDVKALGFAEVVRRLADAGFSAEAAYEALGTRGAASFLAFKNQLPTYNELAIAIAKGGAAAEAQARAMDSLSAQGNRLRNILGDIASTLADPFLDALKVVTRALGDLLEDFAGFTRGLADATGSSEVATFATRTLGFALLGLTVGGVMGAVIGGIFGFVSALGGASDALDEQQTKVNEAVAAYDSQQTTISLVDDAINRLIDRQANLKGNTAELTLETINLGNQFKDLQTDIGNTAISYEDLLDTMIKFGVEQRRIQGELAQTKLVEQEALRDQLRQQLGQGRGYNVKTANRELGNSFVSTAYFKNNKGGDYGAFRKQITDAFTSTNAQTVRQAYNEIVKLNSATNGSLRETLELLQRRMDILAQIGAAQAEVQLAERQIQASAVTTGDTYVRFERSGREAQQTIGAALFSNEDKPGSGDSVIATTTAKLEKEITELKTMAGRFKANSQEWFAIQQLISQRQGLISKTRRAARVADEGGEKRNEARTGSPLDDIVSAADYARGQGFRVGKIGPNGVSRGAGHAQNRAVDINTNGLKIDADDARQRAKLDALADYYHKKGYTVLWNKKWYKPDGTIAAIPNGWGDHRDHLHVEAPELGITVGGLGDIGRDITTGAAAQADREARDLFSLQKARAANRVGGAQSTISTILKEAKAGMFSPSQLRERLDAAMIEFVQASLNKFDVDNPIEELTQAALDERTLARQELLGALQEKVGGFTADLNRQISDYAIDVFDDAIDAIERELDNAVYRAEDPVRRAENMTNRANSPLNRRSNADDGTQYYLQQQNFSARLGADQQILRDRLLAESARQNQIDLLAQEAASYPEDQQAGEAYLEIQKKIAEATAELNEHKRESLLLQEGINARTQEYVALPLNERLRQGVAAWADQSGVMDTYQDVLANNVVPALNMVTDGLTTMISNLVQGKASIREALGSMLSSIADFVVKLIARAMALMAIKWFLKLIGLELIDTPGGVSIGKVGGKMKGGEIPGQMTGGLAGKPMKFQYGGSVPRPFISQGVSNRDGVPAYLAQGEYVLRREAVRSIGLPVMDEINRFGAKALSNMQQSPIIMGGGGQQQTNVYIVAPEEKPQLGPNDVLAIISNDVLRGGTTKKLIKSVSNG